MPKNSLDNLEIKKEQSLTDNKPTFQNLVLLQTISLSYVIQEE